MKKLLAYFLLILSVFSSCKKEDAPAFTQSPDQRINEALSNYQSKLVGAANGWKAFIYPKGGGTYFFYFKFNDQNRVKMYSTFDSASAVTALESSYRLKALQQPSLIFDTYSYVQVLADPNEFSPTVRANINGGPVGTGLSSDFEFYFDSTSTDTIRLVGRVNGSKAVLIRATQQEAASYDNKGLGNGFLIQNLGKYLNYFKRVTIGGIIYEINVDQFLRTITFNWVGAGGNLQSFTTSFYYSDSGITFLNPLVNGSQTITGFTNLTWNAATTTLGFSVNGTATTVIGLGQPLKVDLTAPQRWWQYSVSQNDYWLSGRGFHVNGFDDAFNWRSVSGFQYLLFWAKYGTSGGVTYDLLGPVVNNALNYGAAFRPPTFTPDGRVIFTFFGTLGTVPASANTSFTNTRLQMAEANGYYLVQTGPLSYDMVSAKDGKAWITWVF